MTANLYPYVVICPVCKGVAFVYDSKSISVGHKVVTSKISGAKWEQNIPGCTTCGYFFQANDFKTSVFVARETFIRDYSHVPIPVSIKNFILNPEVIPLPPQDTTIRQESPKKESNKGSNPREPTSKKEYETIWKHIRSQFKELNK